MGSAFAHDGPGDACRLVGDGDRDDLGWLLGQELGDPGMLLGMLSGMSYDGRGPDHQETPQIRRFNRGTSDRET